MSSRKLFGTDGIRGPAGQYPLDKAGACQIGKAIGVHFGTPDQSIIIGRDPRESSPMLEAALVAGITAVGVDTTIVGVIPTPGLAYLTQATKASAGVMITASHNTYQDNGIKIFSAKGGKLPDSTEAQLNQLIASHIAEQEAGKATHDTGLVQEYVDFLVSSIGPNRRFDGMRLAVDCANGATSFVAGEVFNRVGAEAVTICNKPDGQNINAGCGATDTTALQKAVTDQGLDGGIAFDGDGDRVMMVDAQGRLLTGDHMLYILALGRGEQSVVGTIMSNGGFESALKKQGIQLIRTAVGDRYVLEELEKSELRLGGEQSGHIILYDLLPTGDGLLAAIQTLRYVVESGKSLAEWYDKLPLVPQALVNIPLASKQLSQNPAIAGFIAKKSAELGDNTRLSIRPSGTEPKLRVMVEAADADKKARDIASQLSKLLKTL